jgi:hypothetical protein
MSPAFIDLSFCYDDLHYVCTVIYLILLICSEVIFCWYSVFDTVILRWYKFTLFSTLFCYSSFYIEYYSGLLFCPAFCCLLLFPFLVFILLYFITTGWCIVFLWWKHCVEGILFSFVLAGSDISKLLKYWLWRRDYKYDTLFYTDISMKYSVDIVPLMTLLSMHCGWPEVFIDVMTAEEAR